MFIQALKNTCTRHVCTFDIYIYIYMLIRAERILYSCGAGRHEVHGNFPLRYFLFVKSHVSRSSLFWETGHNITACVLDMHCFIPGMLYKSKSANRKTSVLEGISTFLRMVFAWF